MTEAIDVGLCNLNHRQRQSFLMDEKLILERITQTLDKDLAVREASEKQLSLLEAEAFFLPFLLRIVASTEITVGSRQAGVLCVQHVLIVNQHQSTSRIQSEINGSQIWRRMIERWCATISSAAFFNRPNSSSILHLSS